MSQTVAKTHCRLRSFWQEATTPTLGKVRTCLAATINAIPIPTTELHSRRATITPLASAALLPAGHLVAATNASPDDERFMRIALEEGRQGDPPFGTVIVH